LTQYDKNLTPLTALKFKVPMLVQVRDLHTSNDEKKKLDGILRKSALQVQILKEVNPDVKNILYTYADFASLPSYAKKKFANMKLPFYTIIEDTHKNHPYVYLFPGKTCYNQTTDHVTNITSHSQITEFVREYFTG